MLEQLDSLRALGHQVFVQDALSLLDRSVFRRESLLTSGQVTDTYLLGIAVYHGAALASFDKRLVPSTVVNGDNHLFVMP